MAIKINASQTEDKNSLPFITGAAGSDGDVINAAVDGQLAKLFEDRNAVLAQGGLITFLGTSVEFTENLKLEINSRVAGGSPQSIDLGATTRTVSADGKMIYAVVNRSAGTATVTADATSLPAVTNANQEVFLIARRIDSADGPRLYFRDGTVLDEGQQTRLGSSGGGLPTEVITVDQTLEVNKCYIVDSASEVVTKLPDTNRIGDEIEILVINTGGWKLQANDTVNQVLRFGADELLANMEDIPLLYNTLTYSSVKIRASAENEWIVEFHVGVGPFVGNYFGDESDSSLSTSGNVNISSTTDSDMVVKNYINLTVNSGHTLTVTNRCKGLLIYCTGDLVVDGTISMSSRGANVDPVSAGVAAAGLKIRRVSPGGTDTNSDTNLLNGCGTAAVTAENNQVALDNNGTVFTVNRAGAGGASAVTAQGNPTSTAGNAGSNGATGESGGGGSGGAGSGNNSLSTSGAGAAGTCFSGGAAGGGGRRSTGAAGTASSGAANGGAGGNATQFGDSAAGGAGNPGGTRDVAGGDATDGSSGTGGLLIIIVKGSVTVGASGSILARGAAGGNTIGTPHSAAGGGSGGGNIILLYAGTLTNNGTISASGGSGGTVPSGSGVGGAGGVGSVQTAQIGE